MRKLYILPVIALFLSVPVRAQQPGAPKPSKPAKTTDVKATPTPAPTPKPESVLENLRFVDQVEKAPDAFRTGLESITERDFVTMLRFVSADSLEGRQTATRGYAAAADYAASQLALWGLKPGGDIPEAAPSRRDGPPPALGGPSAREQGKRERSFLQAVPLKEIVTAEATFEVAMRDGAATRSRTFERGTDFTVRAVTRSESWSAPVVFVGYGIKEESIGFDEYKGLDVRGKVVLMLSGAPRSADKDSPFSREELRNKYGPSMRRMTSPKADAAKELGAIAVLTVNAEDAPGREPGRRRDDSRPIVEDDRDVVLAETPAAKTDPIPSFVISRDLAEALLARSDVGLDERRARIDKDLKPASQLLEGVTVTFSARVKSKPTSCSNVVAFIEGSDPELKNEAVVIGAHYDHLGTHGPYLYNGADDNGSGSVAVLAIAHAFVANPKPPKRTVVFALWTGEEDGLLGSRYYTLHPAYPLGKTIAYINMDMISRVRTEDRLRELVRSWGDAVPEETAKKVKADSFMSVSLSQNDDLATVLREADRYVGLTLQLRKSASARGGSDHASFGQAKVPWVSLISTLHDDYHQPGDTIDKVNGAFAEKVAHLVYTTAWLLADR